MGLEQLTGGDGTSGQSGKQFRDMCQRMFTELYSWAHTKLHALNSVTDHAAATGTDKGKFVATNPTTGAPELRFLETSDIPNAIARQAALEAHTGDYNNPHRVTAEQLGITTGGGTEYTAGPAIVIDGSVIAVDPNNCEELSTLNADDVFIMGVLGTVRRMPFAVLKDVLAATFNPAFIRTQALGTNETYYGVEVLASGDGITATLTDGNVMTFIIPVGVKLFSAKIRFTGYSTLICKMGTGDMGNSSEITRWMPIIQAWREDTHQQLTGLTSQPDASIFDKFTISGLINSATNQIRLTF